MTRYVVSAAMRRIRPARQCEGASASGRRCKILTKRRKPGTSIPLCIHHGGQ